MTTAQYYRYVSNVSIDELKQYISTSIIEQVESSTGKRPDGDTTDKYYKAINTIKFKRSKAMAVPITVTVPVDDEPTVPVSPAKKTRKSKKSEPSE